MNNHIHSNNPLIEDSDYMLSFTKGIIFAFEDGTELSFELFSEFTELLDISSGTDLVDKLKPLSTYVPKAEASWEIDSSMKVLDVY